MSTLYRTRDGDMLDRICQLYYGHTDGTVELVLAANKGLALKGPLLPAGLVIDLPDAPAAPEAQPLQLWD